MVRGCCGSDVTATGGSEFEAIDSGRGREPPGLGSGRFGDGVVDGRIGTVVTGVVVGMADPFGIDWPQAWDPTACTGLITVCGYACGGYVAAGTG